MIEIQIKKNLCYYDKRNPNCGYTDEEIHDHAKLVIKEKMCYCGNCFYGRTELAEELMKVKGE